MAESRKGFTVSFNVEPISSFEDDTPATKTYIQSGGFKWTAGDRVGIYPNTGGQVYFDMVDGDSASSTFDGGGWDFRDGARYVSYYPFIPETYLDRENVPLSYVGQCQTGKETGDDTTPASLGKFDYMCTDYVSEADGVLSFKYHRAGFFWRFNISNIPAGTYRKLAVTASDKVFTAKGHWNLNAENNYMIIPDETSDTLSMSLKDIVVSSQSDPSFYIFMMAAPLDLTGQNVTVSLFDEENSRYDCEKTISRAYERNTFNGVSCSSWTLGYRPLESIRFDSESKQVNVGSTFKLDVIYVPEDATDTNIVWSTSNTAVATVDNGVVTSVKVGTATVSATVGDKTATCEVIVTARPVETVSVDKTSLSLRIGEDTQLSVSVYPNDDDREFTVSWSSSDEDIAKVSDGLVSSLSKGRATINATVEGKVGKCVLNVTYDEEKSIYYATSNDGIMLVSDSSFGAEPTSNKYLDSFGVVLFDSAINSIAKNAFSSPAKLTSISIPSSITSIAANAFSGCSSLKTIMVYSTVPPTLGDCAFDDCDSDFVIYVPDASYDQYISVWSVYASHIKKSSENNSGFSIGGWQSGDDYSGSI